jgi:hypothetical protein
MSHARPRSGVEIAKRLELPLETYYETLVFRSNLLGLGFTTELANVRHGMAILVYSPRYLFRVTIQTDRFGIDRLWIEAQPLDGGRLVEILREAGGLDFERVFNTIVRYESLQPLPLRPARRLRRA